MEIYYDFHIHSVLSPCGDEDMTPNNIINMAKIKGLDFIALTDHNCCKNIPAAAECAKNVGIGFLPGIELNTAEEVHLLGYFKDVKSACDFGEEVYKALPNIKNNPDFFGRQVVMNEYDEKLNEAEKLLISALPWSFEESVLKIIQAGGLAVPAHINKSANSIFSNLGMMPQNKNIHTVETSEKGMDIHFETNSYNILTSSDAHYLWDISEKSNKIMINNNKIVDVFDYINGIEQQ